MIYFRNNNEDEIIGGKVVHSKRILFILFIILIALLAACNGQSAEEKIHNHLEEAVSKEEGFENVQSEIVDLEEQEQNIYNQIIDLSMDDFDKIVELADQAIEIIDQRAEKIGEEKESIQASQEEFNEIENLISDIEEGTTKETAEAMYDKMNSRYDTYAELNDAYVKSLELEKDLYTMLKEEDLEQDKLTEHINSINESYEQVLTLNEKFNKDTQDYNELKKNFYETAGLGETNDQE